MWYSHCNADIIAPHQAAPDVLHKASNQWSRINVVFDKFPYCWAQDKCNKHLFELLKIRCVLYPFEMDNQRWIELFAIHFKVTMVPGCHRRTSQRSRGVAAWQRCHQSCSSNRRCQLWSRSRARSSCDEKLTLAQCGFLAAMLEKSYMNSQQRK